MKKKSVSRGNVDFLLFCTTLILVAIGVVMVYSASSYIAFYQLNDSMYYLKKQGLFAVVGILMMLFTMKIDYHVYKKYTKILMLITTCLLFVVFAFVDTNGARRWIPLGIFNLQPSEIAKYVIVLFMAVSIERKGEKIKSFAYGVMPYVIVSVFYAGLILAEKNLSIASIVMFVTLIILFAAGAKIWHLVCVIIPMICAGAAAIYFEPYRLKRLLIFRNPWADPKKFGYQLIQSFLALGSGGIWGVGLGCSRQKCFYIPEPHNDFIFAIIGEELGLIGCIIIIILFVAFVWRGIVTSIKAKDVYGTIMAAGITSVIGLQALINIAVVTGSIPVTGVPLPFISSGGSSLIVNLVAVGILLNISKDNEYN